MSLEVEQVNLDNEDFDIMFGNKLPESTASADTLIGKEKVEETTPAIQGEPNLRMFDTDVDTDDLLGVKPDTKPEPKPKAKPTPAPANINPDPNEDEEEDDPEPVGGKEIGTKPEETDDESPVDFKAVTEFLISEGVWEDFQEKDKIDYDPKTFSELWKEQALSLAEGYFNELVDQSGPYGKAVLQHAKNNGNPEEILDLFRENKRIQNLDISTPEAQEAVTREYYKTLNWSKDKIEKEIRKKREDLEMEEESQFAKGQLEERVQKEVQLRQVAQESKMKEEQEREKQFAANITNTLKARTDLTDADRKEAQKALLNYDKKLEDGRYVNQFYLDFMKMQSDPNSYIDLVLFVRDKNAYLGKVSKQAESTAAKKTFNLIKGNGAVSGKKDGGYVTQTSTKRKERDLVIPVK